MLVKPEPFSTIAVPGTIVPLVLPSIRRVPEDRPPPFIGKGSRLLYEIIRYWTWLPEPEWEIRLMLGWNDRHMSTTPDALYWSKRIAIYADGPRHLELDQSDRDNERRNWLQWGGFSVLVFSNNQLALDAVGVGELLAATYRARTPDSLPRVA